jgi:hypothetical protein
MDDNILPKPATNVVALFEAPQGPEGEEHASHSDPLNKLGDEERDVIRLRSMKVNDIVLEFLGTRDLLDEKRAEYNALEKRLKEELERKSMILKEKADELGVDNFNVRGVATAYRNNKTSYRVGDWDAFSAWVLQTGNTQCLEKRVAKLATVEVEKHLGEVPPGVLKEVEQEFLVRRTK